MRVLIFGGGGQDGKYLGEILKSTSLTEIILSCRRIPSENSPLFVNRVQYLKLDITSSEDVQRGILKVNPDVIVNFASVSSVVECENQPNLTRTVNEIAPIKVMELLAQPKNRHIRFIQASSSEMFSNSAQREISEETKTSPNNHYGRQKAVVHQEIIERQKNGEQVSSLIYFNHESPLRSNKFVSKKIISAVSRISKGSNEKLILGNIESTRDWGFAGDYMGATSKVIFSGLSTNYVIGTGHLHSIAQFCDIAFKFSGIANTQQWIEQDPRLIRKTDSIGLYANASKLKNKLDWAPSVLFEDLVSGMLQAENAGTFML